MAPEEVLQFWFVEYSHKDWYKKDPAFDELIRSRFGEVYQTALAGRLAPWRVTPEGRLAEIILLDQFSRNMFRGTLQAFEADTLAFRLAQEAIRAGDDQLLNQEQRQFLYMPYMHSESKEVHEEALALFTKLGDPHALRYEQEHKAIIDRFGRYPARNQALGRMSTSEEMQFLKEHPGF